MSCAFLSGFETGNIAANETEWSTGSVANFSHDTGTVLSGLRSGKFTGAGYLQSLQGFNLLGAVLRVYVRISGTGVSTASRIFGLQATGGHLTTVTLRTDRKLELNLNGPPGAETVLAVTTQVLAANTWYALELLLNMVHKQICLRVDGTVAVNVIVAGFANGSAIDNFYVGPDEASLGVNIFYDDIQMNRLDGTHNSAWPGSSLGLVMYVPTADHFNITWVDQNPGNAFFEELNDLPAANIDTTTYIKEATGASATLGLFMTQTPLYAGLVSAVLVGIRGGGVAAVTRTVTPVLMDANNEAYNGTAINFNLNGWKTVYPALVAEETWDGVPRPLTTDYIFGNNYLLANSAGLFSEQFTNMVGAPPFLNRFSSLRLVANAGNVTEVRVTAVWMMVALSVPFYPNVTTENRAPRILVDLDLP